MDLNGSPINRIICGNWLLEGLGGFRIIQKIFIFIGATCFIST